MLARPNFRKENLGGLENIFQFDTINKAEKGGK